MRKAAKFKIDWLAVIRDLIIIWVVMFPGLFLIALYEAQLSQAWFAKPILYILVGSVGFAISGCIARIDRFEHLFIVAIIFWLTTFFAVLLDYTMFPFWFFGIIHILIMMGIGGGLSLIFVPNPRQQRGTVTSATPGSQNEHLRK